MSEIKTIGVLTSGGDAPGMNACIRSVVRYGISNGLKVMGIMKGYNGLLNGEVEELTTNSVSSIIQKGGTILKTARCKEFRTEEGQDKGAEMCKKFGIDALVVIGGDGSFQGAEKLARRGIKTVGIPGTIDNDIACTDYTIGYDTSVNTAIDAIDKIRDTAESHERVSIVEVMGRTAGHIALEVGVSCGAESILMHEQKSEYDEFVKNLEIPNKENNHSLIIMVEGIGDAPELAKKIEAKTGIETRATILGHIQRGGSPTAKDRVIASKMGAYAVQILLEGKSKRVVAMKDNKIVDFDIFEALAMTKTIDKELYALSKILSYNNSLMV
jgi:6-phosphofructokinase 1